MKEERKNRKSEYTAGMDTEQLVALQQTESMTEEELVQFRNSLDPDSMGFCGEEGT